jgi:uncharacterized protein (TIGR02147 family)
MVESSDSRSKINREESQRRLTDRIKDLAYSKLSEETFELISNWHYYAFFELLETKNFVFKPSWISERLKIDFFDSEKMIENLKRLKILKKIGNSWKLSQKNYSSIDQVPSYSIRKFTKQVLVKAIDAIDSQSIDERLIGTVTSAIHLEDLPKIMDKINAQKFELDRYIAQLNSKKNVKPDEVYTYAVQFFRISQTVRSSLSSSLKENN